MHVVVLSSLGYVRCFFVEFERWQQLAALSGHVAQLEQAGAQIMRIFGQAVGGSGLLEMAFGHREIAALHRHGMAQQPVAAPEQPARSRVGRREQGASCQAGLGGRGGSHIIIADERQIAFFKISDRLGGCVTRLVRQIQILLPPTGRLRHAAERLMDIAKRPR
jgi:hypothetical protein